MFKSSSGKQKLGPLLGKIDLKLDIKLFGCLRIQGQKWDDKFPNNNSFLVLTLD